MFFKFKKRKSFIKKIFLHVGFQKTATTSIQQSLFNNSDYLKNIGYIYPKSLPINHSHSFMYSFDVCPEKYTSSIAKKYGRKDVRKIGQNNLNDLEKELCSCQVENLIISGEGIILIDKSGIRKLKKYLHKILGTHVEIEVLICTRNPVSHFKSIIQQNIIGEGKSQDLLVKDRIEYYLDNTFRKCIVNFIEVFGKDSVRVYSFEEAVKHEFGPVGSFLSKIGLSEKEISDIDIIKSNEGISQISADIINFINTKYPLLKMVN